MCFQLYADDAHEKYLTTLSVRSMADRHLQDYLDQIPENYRLRKLDDDHRLATIAGNIPIWENLAGYMPNINPTTDIVSIQQNNQGNYPGQR